MRECHPYGEFIPNNPESMIIGSFPIGKFSHPDRRHEIKGHELDFFFGGEKNLLWKLLGKCYGKDLKTKAQVIKLLEEKHMAIGDLIKSCRRKSGGGSDADLYDIEWNVELIEIIRKHKIKKLYFTSRQVQKWFMRLFGQVEDLEQVLLISPSAQSARALVRMQGYIAWRKHNPQGKALDYILESYRHVFK